MCVVCVIVMCCEWFLEEPAYVVHEKLEDEGEVVKFSAWCWALGGVLACGC